MGVFGQGLVLEVFWDICLDRELTLLTNITITLVLGTMAGEVDGGETTLERGEGGGSMDGEVVVLEVDGLPLIRGVVRALAPGMKAPLHPRLAPEPLQVSL